MKVFGGNTLIFDCREKDPEIRMGCRKLSCWLDPSPEKAGTECLYDWSSPSSRSNSGIWNGSGQE